MKAPYLLGGSRTLLLLYFNYVGFWGAVAAAGAAQAKGRICENLRFSANICVLGSVCHLRSVPLTFSDCNRSQTLYSQELLQACYRAPNPPNPENPKKIQNPPPRGDPRKPGKKKRKNTKTGQKWFFGPLLYFFGIFFGFSGATPGWGILYLFRIFGIWGFWGSVAGPRGRSSTRKNSCRKSCLSGVRSPFDCDHRFRAFRLLTDRPRELDFNVNKEQKISSKFSCIKFFQIWDVPTQIPGHPIHSLSKTTAKGHLHQVFVRDIPTSGSLMSQEYPAQKLYL